MENMVDMENDEQEKNMQMVNRTTKPAFPQCLRIRFDNSEIEKIPMLKDVKVGDRLSIKASACVVKCSCSSNIEDGEKEEEHNVDVQIEKMSIEPETKKKLEDVPLKEYRKMRRGK